jgi:hypothetical protein
MKEEEKMKHIILLMLICCISVLSAIVVNHVPPLGFDPAGTQELKLEVIQGWTELSTATLYFRVQGTAYFEQTPMQKDSPEGNILTGFLPATKSPDKGYEYYFSFALANGSVESLPPLEPEKNPYLINPASKSGTLSDGFILLSDEDKILARDGFTFAASWFALEDNLDINSLRVFINGKDVTLRTNITNTMLIYRNTAPRPGTTTMFITAKTLDGKQIFSPTWTTIVMAGGNITTLPMNLRGSFNAGTTVLKTDLDAGGTAWGDDTDDGWASLELYGEHKKLSLSSYSYVSTLENAKTQAINRYRVGMMLPHWTTYAGDYSPSISSLTMSNKNLRGLYSNLYFKYFGFTVAHGEMLRAVNGDKYLDGSSQTAYTAGTFKQEALATRLQLGKEDGLLIGFNTSRNRDIISSLDNRYVKQDTTQIAFPNDNLVLSIDARLTIPKQKIVVGIEGAGSIFNKNTLPGPLDSNDLEDYLGSESPVNPANFSDFFIINTNMQPLPLSGKFEDPAPFTAWQAYYRSYFYNNLLNFNYSEVGSSYKALSTGYLQNDASQLSITDQYNYQQHFFVSGGFNRTKDNLAGFRLETNIYDTYYGQFLFRLQKLPYLSIVFSNSLGKNEPNAEINADPTLYSPYKRDSKMLSFGMGYEFNMIPIVPSNLDISYRNSAENEQRPDLNGDFVKSFDNVSQNFSVSVINKFEPIPLKTTFSIAVNNQNLKTSDARNSNLNFMAKSEYKLWENRLQPWLEFRTTSLGGDQPEINYNYLTAGIESRPLEATTVSTSVGIKTMSNDDQPDSGYSTTTWRLTMSQRF